LHEFCGDFDESNFAMHDLTHIKLPDLFDMLSDHTSLYMKMLSDGASKDEVNECSEIITDIQTEIRSRQTREKQPTTSAKNPSFNPNQSRHGLQKNN